MLEEARPVLALSDRRLGYAVNCTCHSIRVISQPFAAHAFVEKETAGGLMRAPNALLRG